MNCVFCKIINKEIPAQIVYENHKIIAFLDIKPNNPGHTLIVPKEHYHDLLETPDDTLAVMITTTRKIAPTIMKAVHADGFNTIINTKPAAGQAIFHTHLHIIPRFVNDGLKHWPHKNIPATETKRIQDFIHANIQ